MCALWISNEFAYLIAAMTMAVLKAVKSKSTHYFKKKTEIKTTLSQTSEPFALVCFLQLVFLLASEPFALVFLQLVFFATF